MVYEHQGRHQTLMPLAIIGTYLGQVHQSPWCPSSFILMPTILEGEAKCIIFYIECFNSMNILIVCKSFLMCNALKMMHPHKCQNLCTMKLYTLGH